MKRQSYIHWERFTGENDVESGKRYLVADAENEKSDVVNMSFATYYGKGDVVMLEKKDGHDKPVDTNLSAEERLLACIFGNYKECVVPEDGFYIKTGDYGVDEKIFDGAFRGCREELVLVGGKSCPCFFAEMPLPPEGYVTIEDYRKNMAVREEQEKKRREQARMDDLKGEMESDPVITRVIRFMTDEKDLSYETRMEKPFGKGIYSMPTAVAAEKAVRAKNVVHAFMMLEEKKDLTSVKKKLSRICRKQNQKELHSFIKGLSKEVGADESSMWTALFALSEEEADFYDIRDRYIMKNKRNKEKAVPIMIKASAKTSLPTRIKRVARLTEMGVPEVIRENEIRMLAGLFINMECEKYLVSAYEDEFEKMFGIRPDGSEYEGDSWIGNMERMVHDECQENCDECEEFETCGGREDPGEIGVDYPYFAVCHSPNHKAFDFTYAIFDNENKKYYRENGEIAGFDDLDKAHEKRQELEAKRVK